MPHELQWRQSGLRLIQSTWDEVDELMLLAAGDHVLWLRWAVYWIWGPEGLETHDTVGQLFPPGVMGLSIVPDSLGPPDDPLTNATDYFWVQTFSWAGSTQAHSDPNLERWSSNSSAVTPGWEQPLHSISVRRTIDEPSKLWLGWRTYDDPVSAPVPDVRGYFQMLVAVPV